MGLLYLYHTKHTNDLLEYPVYSNRLKTNVSELVNVTKLSSVYKTARFKTERRTHEQNGDISALSFFEKETQHQSSSMCCLWPRPDKTFPSSVHEHKIVANAINREVRARPDERVVASAGSISHNLTQLVSFQVRRRHPRACPRHEQTLLYFSIILV